MEIPVNTVLNVSQNEIELAVHGYQGCREDCWGPGQIQKVEPLLCERGLGACPRKFYMPWSVFWGLLRLLFTHAYSIYIIASCSFCLAVSDQKVWCTGQLCKAKKQADLKSTIQWNKPLKEARIGYEWWTRSYVVERAQHCLGPPSHWGPRTNFPCCPSPSVALVDIVHVRWRRGFPDRGGVSGHAADILLFSNLLLTRLQPWRAWRWGTCMDLPQLGPVAVLLLKSRKSAACPETPRPHPETPSVTLLF